MRAASNVGVVKIWIASTRGAVLWYKFDNSNFLPFAMNVRIIG